MANHSGVYSLPELPYQIITNIVVGRDACNIEPMSFKSLEVNRCSTHVLLDPRQHVTVSLSLSLSNTYELSRTHKHAHVYHVIFTHTYY